MTGQRFRSAGVWPGRYRLMLDDGVRERAIAQLDLPPGLSDLGPVAWPQTGEILLEGSNLAACTVTLVAPESQQVWHLGAPDSPWSPGNGWARISDVPPGAYELRVERGRAIDRRTITVESDAVTEVQLQLGPERKLNLLVSSDRALYPDESLTLEVLGLEQQVLLTLPVSPEGLTHDRFALWTHRTLVPYEAASLRIRSGHGLSAHGRLEEAKTAPLKQFAPIEMHLTHER